jgi:hypothetical protein
MDAKILNKYLAEQQTLLGHELLSVLSEYQCLKPLAEKCSIQCYSSLHAIVILGYIPYIITMGDLSTLLEKENNNNVLGDFGIIKKNN